MTATRTKRILSVQPVSDGGGSEHALVRLVGLLGDDGWECHVAVPARGRLEDEYVAAGAHLHVVAMDRLTTSGPATRWLGYSGHWPVTVARLAALVRRVDAQIVHTNSLHCWYGWAAAAATGRPHVWHAREIVFQSGAALRVERLLARRFADVVVAASGAVASQLHPANVVVVRDGVDVRRFHPGRAGSWRAARGIADDVSLVGSVARIDTWKGFDVLLDAFTRVRASRPGTELVLAGGPVPGKETYEASLRARAQAMDGVHWLGADADVAELMADLDLFVQVSTEPEPYGLVLVEALASGVPVVAGASGGPLEILAGLDGDAGRLVAPGDPAALADAVVEMLPGGPSGTASRRARPARQPAGTGSFAEVVDELLGRRARS